MEDSKKLKRFKKIAEPQEKPSSVSTILDDFRKRVISCEQLLMKISDVLERQEFLLKSVENTNKIVDETASNILLAIRQNEYLQAWYPTSPESMKFKTARR